MGKIHIIPLKEVDYDVLFGYISLINRQFVNPLENRTSLDVYTSKLLALGDGFLARSRKDISGIIAGYNNDMHTKAAYISLLFVSPEWRGFKIGHMLLEAFLKSSIEKGMKKAVVFTNHANKEALGLYEKHGFIKQSLPEDINYQLNKIL